ncbi:MAG: hypothetical protein A2Y80_08015 [Deltaproteobacteria bacterium RBG_13_58_19]|nr:MAG: hypothetical protein A2Y80_08015 [Deltaproteobacteria bacterium RBG_13_58_19]
MPYADPEKRRQYNTRYKQRWRKARAKIHPLLGFRIYVCPVFPHLRVGRDQFRDSFLITDSPETQVQVERHPEFGRFIFPIALDLSVTIIEDEEE